MSKKGKILAVDLGVAKTGFAVSDSNRMMAFGRGVLKHKSQKEIFAYILNLVEQEKIVEIIIGLPVAVDGDDTPQTLRIKKFGSELLQFLSVEMNNSKNLIPEIGYIDESFTTFESQNFLNKIKADVDLKKQTEDELAAIFLLHRYIDFRP